MGINGNISTMSLAEVFQWIQSGQKTGTLHIESRSGISKDVYFEHGVIRSASSSDPSELIGQFLLSTRHITEQQLADALEAQRRDHVLLGKILVQKKILAKDQLFGILRTISEEIIYDLFLWKEGRFEFIDDKLPKQETPSLQLDTTHIMLEGAQREDEWKRIKELFPDMTVVIKPRIEVIAERLPLKTNQARLLSLVNGIRSLADIIRLSKYTKFKLLSNILDLHHQGLLEVGDYREQMIQPHIHTRRNPVKEVLSNIEYMMSKGRLSDAERGIQKLEHLASNHPEVQRLRAQIQERRLENTAKQMINPNAIPVLKMDVDSITKMDLSAEQGFIVSRINGVWDVKSIIKISPFGEAVCLKILKKFLDEEVIFLK